MGQFIMEKEQKKANETGNLESQLISTYNYDSAKEEMVEVSTSAKMLIAAIFKRKPHTCLAYGSAG